MRHRLSSRSYLGVSRTSAAWRSVPQPQFHPTVTPPDATRHSLVFGTGAGPFPSVSKGTLGLPRHPRPSATPCADGLDEGLPRTPRCPELCHSLWHKWGGRRKCHNPWHQRPVLPVRSPLPAIHCSGWSPGGTMPSCWNSTSSPSKSPSMSTNWRPALFSTWRSSSWNSGRGLPSSAGNTDSTWAMIPLIGPANAALARSDGLLSAFSRTAEHCRRGYGTLMITDDRQRKNHALGGARGLARHEPSTT